MQNKSSFPAIFSHIVSRATQERNTLFLLAFLIVVATVGRLIPHPANVSPVAAAAVFAGYVLPGVWLAALVPLCSMLLSNIFIGHYDLPQMVLVNAFLVLSTFWGPVLRKVKEKTNFSFGVFVTSLGASLMFFLGSNLAVWIFSGMYPLTASGLAFCYAYALPFFQFTILGDLAYSTVFFGLYALALRLPLHRENQI